MEEFWPPSGHAPVTYWIQVDGRDLQVEMLPDGSLRIDGRPVKVDVAERPNLSVYSVLLDGASHEIYVHQTDGVYSALVRNRVHRIRVLANQPGTLTSQPSPIVGQMEIRAPLSGLVVDVPVSDGDAVKAGQTLVILESMKMENRVCAEQAGCVGRVGVQVGAVVREREVLMVLLPSPSSQAEAAKGTLEICNE